MALGKEGEVLVSATVRDSVAGKGIVFVDHGVHELKGLGGAFQVYDVATVDGVRRELPSNRTRRDGGARSYPRSRPG